MDVAPNPQKKGKKKKQQVPSGDIVFTKGGSIQTLPALSKRLKSVTDPVIGLQYVWEFRSPSRSSAPLYHCKLCRVQQLQDQMAAHITGWKHYLRYMNYIHPGSMPYEEEVAADDINIRRSIRAFAAELEMAEGRGQIRVVFKEPGDLPAIQNPMSTKNGSVQSIPTLEERLKSVTEPVIGLKHLFEYRNPNKPPLYECKLCKVEQPQEQMVSHITGWKHYFRYMKQNYPDKIPQKEEASTKDPATRKAIKASAAEVEKAEGRGEITVINKEPDVPAFQKQKSAHPSGEGPSHRHTRPDGPCGGSFPHPPFPMRGQPDMGGFTRPRCYGNSMQGPNWFRGGRGNMQRFSNSRPMGMGPDGFGMGLHDDSMGRPHFNDMPMNSGMGPSSNNLATLLKFLRPNSDPSSSQNMNYSSCMAPNSNDRF
ncbi:uncharacterized protein [Hoplias malabaricus]|uniref:uncharacterized protein n=1 Tax=Hoplias malabaricus TaxID=27720 RepID=UPI003461D751